MNRHYPLPSYLSKMVGLNGFKICCKLCMLEDACNLFQRNNYRGSGTGSSHASVAVHVGAYAHFCFSLFLLPLSFPPPSYPPSVPLLSLHSSATLQPLLSDDFEAKSFATQTIQVQMVGETLSKLAEGISLLDKELYSQVVTNYEDLLSQANGIEALESKLFIVNPTPSGKNIIMEGREYRMHQYSVLNVC